MAAEIVKKGTGKETVPKNKNILAAKGTRRKKGRPAKYPWERWLALKEFSLKRGVHFRGNMFSMMSQVRARASRAGLFVSLVPLEGEGIIKVRVGDLPFGHRRKKGAGR